MKVICPNFKNKEVKEQFEELSNVLGENTAYYIWSYNNGYSLDYAPNGAQSKLFSDLLEYYKGDRRSAIIAKAKTYSPSFRNWFGDWTSGNKENVSKVLDENNEPLIVYHSTNSNFNTFDIARFGRTDQGDRGMGFYFSENKSISERYGENIMPVFLNIKTEYNGVKERYLGRNRSKQQLIEEELKDVEKNRIRTIKNIIKQRDQKSSSKLYIDLEISENDSDTDIENKVNNYYNKQYSKEYFDTKYGNFDEADGYISSYEIVVYSPNQIKSIDNRGTYSQDNNNIYQYAVDSKINRIDGEESRNVVFFKENQLGKESLQNMLLNNFFEEDSVEIANNIYNKLDDSVQFVLDNDNKGYDAAYDAKSKKVYINPLIFNTYTNKDIGRIILHELLHHFTVNEYNNNNIFKQDIDDLFNKIKNKVNPTKDQLKNPLYYGLNSPLEFISELYTNHSFRDLVLKKNTSLWKRLLTKLLKALKLNKLASKLESKNNDKVNTLINEISNIIDNHHTDSRFDNYGDGLLKYDTKDINLMYINENAKQIAKDILAGLKASEKALRSRGKSPIVLTKLQQTIDKYDTAFLKEDNILITTDFINEASKQFKPVLDLMRKAKFDNSLLSNDDLINFKSDFLDFYGPMCQTIDKELLLQGYFDELSEEQKDAIAIDMDLINRAYNEIQGIYSYILRNRAAQILKEQGEVFGFDTKDIEDYIQNSLNSGEGDINYFTLILRPTMSLKDTIMRITYRMMADLNNNVQTFANEKAQNLIREFDKIDRKDQLLYFEKDNDGKTTGYLIRDRKYGQFFRDKNDFMSELNAKYGVIDGNVYTLNEDEFKEYSREREEWLSKHCERRFKPEYYKQYSNLKSVTQLKLKSLNGEIQSIIQSITRSDGVHLEELDDKSWRNLNRLYLLKRNMSNIYNFDGSLKKGEDRDIAEDLTNFYDNLGSGKIKSLSMTSEEVEKIIKQKEKELSPELFNKWVQRNISYEYTEEFYEQLKKDFNAGKDQDKYESLIDERRKLMRLGRNNLIPKTDAYQLSIDVKKHIKEIDQELQDIRNKYKTLNEKSNFGKIAKMMVTEEYERDKKEAEAKGGKAYDEWYKMSHYTNGRGEDEPVSYYKITIPKDDKYIRIRLSRMNQELDKDSALINPNYDFNNPEYYQPKKELYDNSKEYQKATNTEEKRNIYNLIYNTLQEANDKIPFLNNRSNYKLPQMTGDIIDFSCRGNKFWKGIIKYNVDNLIVRSDDSDYNLDTFTQRPDGSQVKFAPTHYIQDLENPENISRNLVGMLTEYSRMAENYRLKNENASTFEVLGEQMGQRRVTIRNRFTGSQQKIEGKRTRLYQKLNDFYDIQLYGQKQQPALGRISDKLVISYTKLFNRIKKYASASNLSWNIPAIMKAQLQGLHKSLIEALSGRYFSINDYYHALFRQIFSIPKMLYHLGDKKHNTLILALMENAGIARDIKNKIDGLQYNRFIRTLKKYIIWGGWSATDWMVKAPLVESIYSDYMYIPSENNFMSKRAYIRKYHNDNWKEGSKAFKNISTFSLLDVYTVKNGVLVIKSEYEKYANIINNTNLQNSVINTCRFITNRIDGVLSQEDKTKFMTNAVGACVIMHRSFFIRNLDDNLFAELQYNPYIEDYYEAKYTSAFKVLWHYARDLVAVVLKNPNLKSKNRLESIQVYNFKRTAIQLGLILMQYLLVSLYLEPEADKDKKNQLKQMIGYVFAAVRFEEFAEYNPFNFFNQIKSPSAAIAPVENVTNMIKLFDPISFENNFKEIKKGPYKGMERWQRTLIKSVPGLRGVWESRDVRTKWEYLNTQLDK